MSTDYSNANNQTEWIEQVAIPSLGFRIWHVIFLCVSCLLTIIILICCCAKIRIPRTKQEIEADYQRKKIAKKFRERLRLIQNQDMDNMDLKLALERVQTDYESEARKLMDYNTNYNSKTLPNDIGTMKAEPQAPVNTENTTTNISTIFTKTDSTDPENHRDKSVLNC